MRTVWATWTFRLWGRNWSWWRQRLSLWILSDLNGIEAVVSALYCSKLHADIPSGWSRSWQLKKRAYQYQRMLTRWLHSSACPSENCTHKETPGCLCLDLIKTLIFSLLQFLLPFSWAHLQCQVLYKVADADRIVTEEYTLLPGDLREVGLLLEDLQKSGFRADTPTLILAECVLVYMPPEDSQAVLSRLGALCPTAAFVIYEQVGN